MGPLPCWAWNAGNATHLCYCALQLLVGQRSTVTTGPGMRISAFSTSEGSQRHESLPFHPSLGDPTSGKTKETWQVYLLSPKQLFKQDNKQACSRNLLSEPESQTHLMADPNSVPLFFFFLVMLMGFAMLWKIFSTVFIKLIYKLVHLFWCQLSEKRVLLCLPSLSF